jgi:Ca2+-transporting ATPase
LVEHEKPPDFLRSEAYIRGRREKIIPMRSNSIFGGSHLPAAVITKDYHLLPGRLRISVEGLRRRPQLAKRIEEQLAGVAGVRSVSANHLTGRALINFEPEITGLRAILARLDECRRDFAAPRPNSPQPKPVIPPVNVRTAAIHTATTGGVLAGMIVKRLLAGRSPLAASQQVFNAAAVVTLVSGYPILRRSLNDVAKRRRMNAELLLLAATLVLLVMRESITGLSVLWIVHLNNLLRAIVQDRSRREIEAILAERRPAQWAMGGEQAGSGAAGYELETDGHCDGAGLTAGKGVQWIATAAALHFLVRQDIPRSLAVLLAACPEAVELARHSTLGAANAKAVGQGIYMKDAGVLARAAAIDTVVFAGCGRSAGPAWEAAEAVTLSKDYSQVEVPALAVAAAGGARLAKLSADAGQGYEATVDGRRVAVGGESFLRRRRVGVIHGVRAAKALREKGLAVLFVAVDDRLIGLVGCREKERREEKFPAAALASMGVTSLDLTGKVTSMSPEEKSWPDMAATERVRCIERLKQTGRRVMLVAGEDKDGPALAAADVGVVVGGCCSGPAGEAAAVVVAGENPTKIVDLIALGRETGRIVRQSTAFSTSLGAAGVFLAAARLLSPVAATLLLNVSTVGIIANSLRLLRKRPVPAEPAVDLQRFTGRCCSGTVSSVFREDWETLPLATVCDGLGTSDRYGISQQEVARRRARLGANVLEAGARPTFWQLFKEQFKDFMVRVLLGASALSLVMGRAKDALLTMTIVAANAVLGVFQERKAEQAIEALQRIAAPTAKVMRAGRTSTVMAAELVPGDIILLEAGDRVPADARLLTATHFEAEESSLTGETVPVKKNSALVCVADTALADRRNMVFMGTAVTRGRAVAAVVATGMATEMGKIATMIQAEDSGVTPLQRRLEELAKFMVYVCLGIAGLILAVGVWRGLGVAFMIQTAASLAVAAIPEGLTAIVIIALAMGVQRMSKRNIIVRKLSALETLGCATVICSDKTGTLTKNEMTVRAVYASDRFWQVSGEGYAPRGTFSAGGVQADPSGDPALFTTLLAGALCNNARLVRKAGGKVVPLGGESHDGWRIDGDPTEGALLVAAAKAGLGSAELGRYRRVAEIPFDSERRMMSVTVAQAGGMNLYCKGATDVVLAVCSHYLQDGEVLPLDGEGRRRVRGAVDAMAGRAMRVLACAFRPVRTAAAGEKELIFTGLVGMIDPPRPEVPLALAKCRQAGVKVVMITGDHPKTARAVAAEIGLKMGRDGLLEGWQVEAMSDAALLEAVERVAVYARTSPEHKLRIIKALKCRGYIVAMTGDGVNDAPAVKAADIGIAMGVAGTDVTKEAASMTLGDDNFATIVGAVEEGRSIYANIRKAIRYLTATNLGEVVLMLLAVVGGLPLPLLPIQLLWINLVGDGLPAVALVNDPPAGNIMDQPPRTADNSVFAGGLGVKVLSRGLTIGLTSLGVYAAKLAGGATLAAARTLVMVQLAISQFIHIFDCRLESRAGRVGAFSNLWLVGAVAMSMLMVAAAVHLPGLHALFGTTALTGTDWALAAAAAVLTSLADLSLGGFLARKVVPRYPRLAVLN